MPSISVNLSSTNFHDLELPHFIATLLSRYQLKPADLRLEITETVMMDTNPSTTRTIHAIHALGITLSMDDFGTGYSSLGYLRNLPVSELKLDKSFVRDSLHLTVVAEGVEDKEQFQLLKQQGCDVAQGYLFARPAPSDVFGQWLLNFSVENVV